MFQLLIFTTDTLFSEIIFWELLNYDDLPISIDNTFLSSAKNAITPSHIVTKKRRPLFNANIPPKW